MTLDEALALIEVKVGEVIESTLIRLADQLRASNVTGSKLEASLKCQRTEVAAWREKELNRARTWLEPRLCDE